MISSKIAACIFVAAWAIGHSASAAQPLVWPDITAECRPGAYWWWLGSAVNPADLTRELERYRAAGMGGVHIVPIYGARGFESQYIEYLSPKWMEMMHHAVAEGRRLDLFVDMTLGTGWCYGGPNVSDEDACTYINVRTFDVPANAVWKHQFSPQQQKALQVLAAFGPDGKWLDLMDKVGAEGAIEWQSAGGPWRVYTVFRLPSGARVKRAAPGGAGWMLNPLSGDAVRRYTRRFSDAFAANPGPVPRAIYHDSYEYASNWSPDLLDEFARRRGYRLECRLPDLLAEKHDQQAARVKADYRETVSDLIIENYAPAWIGWAREHGMTTRYQAHGSPANLLDLYAQAGIPETEMFNKERDPLVSKFASSAAHTAGRKLVGAEAGTWLKEHFTETLADLKDLVDELFIAGVNHVFYHGTCYSPDEAAWPGWLFYASTEMNPRNPIWRDVPALNAYIARCQAVLQAGRPGNDILLYWPIHDLWQSAAAQNPDGLLQKCTIHNSRDWFEPFAIGRIARRLWRRGFCFDYVSDRQLSAARTEEGRVVLPGGSYRAIVVPPCELMPPETLTALMNLAEAGATVIFVEQLPKDVPGAGNLHERRERFATTLRRATAALATSKGDTLQSATLGQGRVMLGPVEDALRLAAIAREPLVDLPGLRFIRRDLDDGRYYFICNRGNNAFDGWVPLADARGAVAIHEPLTGRLALAAARKSPGGIETFLQLEPGQSMILRSFNADKKADLPMWTYLRPAGGSVKLAGRWRIEFIAGGPELPPPLETDHLASWTALGGEAAERFAGTARYTLRFDAPNASTAAWLLDLGRVCQSARVKLNGRDLGIVFTTPFRLLIDGLQPTGNVLEVEATSVAANRIRDLDRRGVKWKYFHDANVLSSNYKPFDASNWPLSDAGLIGPVRLVPQTSFLPE
jgi:hypothetical protein